MSFALEIFCKIKFNSIYPVAGLTSIDAKLNTTENEQSLNIYGNFNKHASIGGVQAIMDLVFLHS